MKARIAILMVGAVLSGAVLVGCGGDHNRSPPVTTPPPPPPPSTTKNLDTTAVLAIIQTQTSDTAEPFEVDGALIAVTPIGDETSPPQSVDAT